MPRTLCSSNNNDNNKDDNAQILVSVLNPLSPKKAATEEPVEEQTQPTITLEVSPIAIILHISPLSSPIHLVRFGVELRNLVSIMILQQVPGLTFPSDDIRYSGNHDNHNQVPGFTYPTGCLSPIMEMQTPLATPCPSPLPTPLLARL